MSIPVNIYYSGTNGNAKKFVKEMLKSGIVNDIRTESGTIRYDYFFSINDEETVLLIDSWKDQSSLDTHHSSPMMEKITKPREKYNLHMKVERYISDSDILNADKKYIKL